MTNIDLFHYFNAIGWTLLHSLWQAGIIGGIIWLIFRFIPKDNANLRYSVAGIGLLFICLASCITYVHFIGTSTNSSTSPLSAEMLLQYLKNKSTETNTWSIRDLNVEHYFPVIINIWIIGVTVLSLHMITSYFYSLRLKTYKAYPLNSETEQIAINLVQSFGLKQKITFRESGAIQIPSLIGYFKPVVLLPVSMLTGIPKNQLEIIIAHELAHVYRHDYLFQFIQSILELLFFYHPVVWWLSSVVNTEREHICDDLSVTVCGESLTLIKALNNMEAIRKKQYEMVLGFSGKNGKILNRIQRILRPKTGINHRFERFLLSGVFVVLFTGLLLISNFAISENVLFEKQLVSEHSKINLPGSDPTNQNEIFPLGLSSDIHLQTDQNKKVKKKKLSAGSQKETSETIEDERKTETNKDVEKETTSVKRSLAEAPKLPEPAEIPELPEFPEAAELYMFSEDTIRSEEWVKKKAEQIIREQNEAMKHAVEEIENEKIDFNISELREELREELNSMDRSNEEWKSELKKQESELEQQLEELSEKSFEIELKKNQKLHQKELAEHLKEIEKNPEISKIEKEQIKNELKNALERINSKDFHENIKKNLEKARESLQTHLNRIKSGEMEELLQKQRKVLEKELQRIESPEFQKNIQERLEKSKKTIQEQLHKIHTPEYREQLEQKIRKSDKNTYPLGFTPDEKSPRFFVNGKKIKKVELRKLDEKKIESIQVFKGKQAVERYGEEGKNGIVAISVKSDNPTSKKTIEFKYGSSKNSPLFIIDGEKADRKKVERIPADQIEKIDVLKDKKAIAIYGKEAKNGVVVISLKK